MDGRDIREALKLWGIAEANRFAVSRGERTVHALQQVRDHAPGTKADREVVGRDGGDRRRFMAERTSTEKLKLAILPTWAVDPVRATNNADLPHDNPEIAVDQGMPEHLRWIDRLIEVMDREKPMMAACVREEFCTAGSQEVKSRRVKERTGYDGAFTKWNYRAELDKAVIWMEGFAAAA